MLAPSATERCSERSRAGGSATAGRPTSSDGWFLQEYGEVDAGGSMRFRSLGVPALSWITAFGCTDGTTSPRVAPDAQSAAQATSVSTAIHVLEPEQFVRSVGAPVAVRRTISAGALTNVDPPFTLHVVNGPADNRVSSAEVSIDRAAVVRPSDLSQDVAAIERTVDIEPGSIITVELRGSPGSAIELWIDGVAKTETAPTLVTPTAGERIQQNNTATGCRPSSIYGYGFLINFSWTPGAAPKPVESYELIAGYPGAIPIVQAPNVSGTSYLYATCGIVENLLDGWEWRVRPRYADATFGPWSATGTFGFTPMPAKPLILDFTLTAPMYGGPGATRVSVSGAIDGNTASIVVVYARASVPLNTTTNPFASVEFFWDDGTSLHSIGAASGGSLTQTPTERIWSYSFTWDPVPPVGLGIVPIIAVGTAPSGMPATSDAQTVNVVP